MIDINKTYNENCIDTMSRMDNDFIDLVVTSPPYDNLRSYNGYVFEYEPIISQLYRIVKPGGVVVWVVGDATIKGSETLTSFKQALYFRYVGFNLHDTMIYKSHKPPLTHNRYEQEFEYMFVFSKGRPKTFNPIMIKTKYAGSKIDRPKRNQGSATDKASIAAWQAVNTGRVVKDKKIKGNIWEYKTGGYHTTKDSIAFEHSAIFPEKLVHDHIISWSNKGDLVYDPFMGSGTTAKMAYLTNRKWIGSEISKEYCDLIEKRLRPILDQVKLF